MGAKGFDVVFDECLFDVFGVLAGWAGGHGEACGLERFFVDRGGERGAGGGEAGEAVEVGLVERLAGLGGEVVGEGFDGFVEGGADAFAIGDGGEPGEFAFEHGAEVLVGRVALPDGGVVEHEAGEDVGEVSVGGDLAVFDAEGVVVGDAPALGDESCDEVVFLGVVAE